jgi:tol-pal system protein YbgF
MRRIRFIVPALGAGLIAFTCAASAADAREGDAPVTAQTQNPPAAATQPAPAAPAAPPAQRHTPDGRAPGVIELMNQIEDLQAEINRLRGQLEVLTNGLDNAQKRQRDMYLDLDTRMRRMEQGAATGAPRAEAPASPAAADSEPRAKPVPPSDTEARAKPPGATAPAAAANNPPPVTTTQTVPAPTAPNPPARPTAPATTTAAAPASPDSHVRKAYDSGLAAYRSGDYQGAIAAFDGIVKRYPRDPLAPNAQYWIGDAWFNLRDFRSAATAQQTLINSYPDSPKVPDAMLNLGSAYAAQGDGANARRAWEDLVGRYPQTDAAEKARQRLARLK